MKKLTSFEVNSNNREMEAINGVLYTVDRKTLTVKYTLDGVEFQTDYPPGRAAKRRH